MTSYLRDGLRRYDDEPLQERPPGMNAFNEGIYFVGHDAESGISFWTCMHPMPYDFSLLREMLVVYLPDGTLLVARGYGRGRRPRTQAGATLSFTCVEAFHRWLLEFDGVVQTTTQEATLRAPLADGPRHPLRLSVEITSTSPAWLPGAGDSKDAQRMTASPSTETGDTDLVPFFLQLWSFTAVLEWEGKRHELKGTGIRDHSRGNRNLAGHHAHELLGVQFPSGRGFHILRLAGHGTFPGYALGSIVGRDQIQHSNDVAATPLTEIVANGEKITARVQTDNDEIIAEGTTVNMAGWSLAPPNEPVYGVNLSSPGNLALTHGIVRWECEGEIGYGLLERSAKVGSLSGLDGSAGTPGDRLQ